MHVLMRNAALNSARSLVLDQQVTLLVTVVLTGMGIRPGPFNWAASNNSSLFAAG